MPASNAERRLYQRSKHLPSQRGLTLVCATPDGPSVMEAKCWDYSAGGMRLEIKNRLQVGAPVEIVGEIEGVDGIQTLRRRATVRRCFPNGHDRFVVGVSYEPDGDESGPDLKEGDGETVDYYEILQVSRSANPDIIQRAFHLLAKRYHPDNTETGNAELFRQVLEAARVLTDPQLRAAYDAQLGLQSQRRAEMIETGQTSRGLEAERRKRKAVLSLLYGRRLADTQRPSLSLRDLEEMLDCPRDHLQFTLWFLKESKWIRIVENSRYEITLQGVRAVEEAEEAYLPRHEPGQISARREDKDS